MEKEKYEKPEFEMIILLNEVFTEDSPGEESSDDDIFDEEEDALTLLQQLGDELEEGFLEGEETDPSKEENPEDIEGEDDPEIDPTDEGETENPEDIFSDPEEEITEPVPETPAVEEPIVPETTESEPPVVEETPSENPEGF